MAKVGYARVSSVSQSLQIQKEKLSACDKLFEEKHSGTSDTRPALKASLEYIQEGDVLIVTRIDRLARSTLHLCQITDTLSKQGVDLQVLDQNIDTSDATGRLLFNMIGAIGQFETEIRAERQMDSIRKARKRGVQFGKKPALTQTQISELLGKRTQGALIRELMAEYELSKATVYRYLQKAAAQPVPRNPSETSENPSADPRTGSKRPFIPPAKNRRAVPSNSAARERNCCLIPTQSD